MNINGHASNTLSWNEKRKKEIWAPNNVLFEDPYTELTKHSSNSTSFGLEA